MSLQTLRVLRSVRHAVPIAAAVILIACGGRVGTGGGIANPPVDSTAPTVPTNVRTSAVTDTTLTVMWDASSDGGGSGVASYRLFRNNSQIGGTITTAQFADSSLTAGTTYTYAVQAIDGAGNVSAQSGTVQALTTGTPPGGGGGGGQSGLDARPSNTTCLATTQPASGASVARTQVFPNLSFSNFVLLLQVPTDNTKWYAVDQSGIVKMFDNVNNTSTATNYVDITGRVNFGGEAGLLGMAFDPGFATNHRVYLSYTADPTVGGAVLESRISRFTESGGVLNPGSEEILLTIPQPFTNHNGGNIAFGPDGLLYAGFGDGGSGGDPDNHSQDRSILLGKMIRIDVSGNGAYVIPAANPYPSGAGTARCQAGTTTANTKCQEIYAYGFRNPWRWSFDRASTTPDLWIGDVGQDTYEEVDRVQSGGGNYGWRLREAAHCFNPSSGCGTTANGAPLIDPVAEYDHSLGASITGGYVYRGTAISSLVGRYVFADFVSGRLFALLPAAGGGALTRTELLATGNSISSFAQGNDGELYYLDYGGSIFKLVPGAGGGANPIKALLSQTGCMSSTDITQPAAGLIPFAPAASFWSDGASKARWMALPDGARITVENDGDWTFPNGTVLVKNFTLSGNLIETRLFMRHTDTGNWGGYTYRWNTAHTEANLVSGGLDDAIGGQTWPYPSEAQCLQCHTSAASFSLSLETKQLNTTFHYASTNRDANQLTTLQAIGLFANTLTTQPAYPDPFDVAQPVAERARTYLHVNCSQCHRPNGGTPVTMDLRFATSIASTNTCNVVPTAGDLGVTGARVILPGDASKSVLYLRANRRGTNQMPPLASHQIDTQGVALLQSWINGMTATCQ